jgi:hypothetical protein
MPEIIRVGSLIFYFYSDEFSSKGKSKKLEPVHIHVEQGNNHVKIWLHEAKFLEHCQLKGFKDHELTKIKAIVAKQKDYIESEWNSYFNLNQEQGDYDE